MKIGQVERYFGPVELGHKQVISKYINDGKIAHVVESYHKGRPTFKEAIIQGYNYYKRVFYTINSEGKMIKGSMFSEVVTGKEANNKHIHHFEAIG